MKHTELDLVIKILTYSAWLLGGCLSIVLFAWIGKLLLGLKTTKIKEIFFKDMERPNGKPKITRGKF